MSKKGLDLNPNVVAYTILVKGYCIKQDIDKALVVFQEMISRGLKPNRITYNTLIKRLSQVHKYDKIKKIWREWEKMEDSFWIHALSTC